MRIIINCLNNVTKHELKLLLKLSKCLMCLLLTGVKCDPILTFCIKELLVRKMMINWRNPFVIAKPNIYIIVSRQVPNACNTSHTYVVKIVSSWEFFMYSHPLPGDRRGAESETGQVSYISLLCTELVVIRKPHAVRQHGKLDHQSWIERFDRGKWKTDIYFSNRVLQTYWLNKCITGYQSSWICRWLGWASTSSCLFTITRFMIWDHNLNTLVNF